MPPFPPLIAPLLVSVVIVPAFDDPRAARPPVEPLPPLPPLIAPLLVSVVIAPDAFDDARAAAPPPSRRCRRFRR